MSFNEKKKVFLQQNKSLKKRKEKLHQKHISNVQWTIVGQQYQWISHIDYLMNKNYMEIDK